MAHRRSSPAFQNDVVLQFFLVLVREQTGPADLTKSVWPQCSSVKWAIVRNVKGEKCPPHSTKLTMPSIRSRYNLVMFVVFLAGLNSDNTAVEHISFVLGNCLRALQSDA